MSDFVIYATLDKLIQPTHNTFTASERWNEVVWFLSRLKCVAKKLKEPNAFKQVHVSFDTVEWDSGADLDPEFVYSKCHSKQTAQQTVAP